MLDDDKFAALLRLTEELGMQALVEVHNSKEAERVLMTDAKIIGINNRDLKIFRVDKKNTIALIKKNPELKERIVISESGIKNRAEVQALKAAGVNGILVGETLLKSNNIPAKINELLN